MHKKVFVLILVDQITKLLLWPRDFLFGPLHIHPVKNYGLILSLDFGVLLNLVAVTAALIFFLYYFFRSDLYRTNFGKIIFTLILGGAISNIIDRLYLGFVRDFLDLGLGFTFNLADVMIFVGLILIFFKSNEPNISD